MKKEMKASKGAPPSRRTGKGGYMLMKEKKIKAMPKTRKMEPIEKIDYEADFEKAWNESMPTMKESRKQMREGKSNFGKSKKKK